MMNSVLTIFALLPALPILEAYVALEPPTRGGRQEGGGCRRVSRTRQRLLPLVSLSEDLSFLSDKTNERYRIKECNDGHHGGEDSSVIIGIYVPQEDDLPELSTFIVHSFGADAINLSQDFNAVERFLLQPVAGFLNGYSGLAAYTEVLAGLRQRLRTRLQDPSIDAPNLSGLETNEQTKAASQAALLFVLAKPNKEQDRGHDILASVELRLELTDGKIPFSLPWLDRAERRFASLVGWTRKDNSDDNHHHPRSVELQPYLSSLCVDQKYRKRGLGRALVHCCEDVARVCWGCDRLYLHVDPDNTPAVQLYLSEGYQPVKGVQWNPFWAGPASEIGYYVKHLASSSSSS